MDNSLKEKSRMKRITVPLKWYSTTLLKTILCAITLGKVVSLLTLHTDLIPNVVTMHMNPDKPMISDTISNFSWRYSKCSLKSPFTAESSVSQTIYDKLYHKIYENQFKTNPSKECSVHNYWIHNLKWGSGLGFMMKNLAIELILAISRNKTFIYGPNNKDWPFYNSPNILGMDYYFQPITNCKLPSQNILNKLNWSYSNLNGHGQVLDDTAKLYWSSIIPNIFDSNWSWIQYRSLLTVAKWFLFFNINTNTHRIIARNIELSLLNHIQIQSAYPNIDINQIMNIAIAAPIRYSDMSDTKCYLGHFNDSNREMVCFHDKHWMRIIQLMQILYHNIDNINYVILTAVYPDMIEYFKNNDNKTFQLITNDNDFRPTSGLPSEWPKNKQLLNENDLMLSMLTALQLNLLSKYFILNLNSNWHGIIKLFRSHLKCGYNDYGIDNGVHIALNTYCPRCNKAKIGLNERSSLFPNINVSYIRQNKHIMVMINDSCVKWQFIGQSALKCWITI
eukprot:438620_1